VPDARFESFFDEDAMGTGTERSLAATAADEPQAAPPPDPKTAPPAASRRWIAPVIVVIAGGAIAFALTRGGKQKQPVDDRVAVTPPAPDADRGAAIDVAEPAVDTAIEEPPIDAAATPVDAPARVTIKRGSAKPPDPPPPVVLRSVTINAKPWANFTVDKDPTVHQTMKTLQLAPGPHTIKFTNPVLAVEREVTIQVPDRDWSYVIDLQR
jgi:hypothetical protein